MHLADAQGRSARWYDPELGPRLAALGAEYDVVTRPGGSRRVVWFEVDRDDAIRDEVGLFPTEHRPPIRGGHRWSADRQPSREQHATEAGEGGIADLSRCREGVYRQEHYNHELFHFIKPVR